MTRIVQIVIPENAGIQERGMAENLDSGLRRNDGVSEPPVRAYYFDNSERRHKKSSRRKL
jgi:hypothetical protein